MKNKDIKAGMQVWANVSGRKVLVEVTGEHERPGYGSRKPGARWNVKRADNGKKLQPRSGSALHATRDFSGGKPAPMPPPTGEGRDRAEHDAQMAEGNEGAPDDMPSAGPFHESEGW